MKSKVLLTTVAALMLALSLFTGCATSSVQYVPLPDKNAAPDSANARIYVLRPLNDSGLRSLYDGEALIGQTTAKSYLCWDRPAGKTILTNAGVLGQNMAKLPLDAQPGATYYVHQKTPWSSYKQDELLTLKPETGQMALAYCGAPAVDLASLLAATADSLLQITAAAAPVAPVPATKPIPVLPDSVWLKDGTVLFGRLIEMNDYAVTITTLIGDLTIKRALIDTLTTHPVEIVAMPTQSTQPTSPSIAPVKKSSGDKVATALVLGPIGGAAGGFMLTAVFHGFGKAASGAWLFEEFESKEAKKKREKEEAKMYQQGALIGAAVGLFAGLIAATAQGEPPRSQPIRKTAANGLSVTQPNITIQPDAGGLAVRAELLNVKF